ncbi:hexosaminidase D-like [Lineus longissimus]|uniref:hexosaminidase D-like n=1 Tax=Lineus longissimus TaxID=88925 RepID=UPI002B4F124C
MDSTEGHRLVHLDLKGAPPKISYYEKLFPLLHQLGATGLLVEYEDMFPYSGELEVLACKDAYRKDEIEKFKSLAETNNLLVMPLVQTFGHFEFVLKHDKFRHLREVPNYPMALCPALEESFKLVCDMIGQVVELHPGLPWFHIGADEVFHMGVCDKCKSKKLHDIYLVYIKKLALHLRKQYPGMRPVMWDDVYRGWPLELLQGSGIGDLVEPMVWNYNRTLHFPPGIWERYSSVFDNIWFASAFKGATGSAMYLTDFGYHCDNHLSWLAVMKEEKARLKTIRGVALTGWQRYDHYAVLCEILPVSIPCLALCLQTLVNGSFTPDIHQNVSQALHFKDLIPCNPFLVTEDVLCGDFPGSAIYKLLHILLKMNAEYEDFLKDDRLNGWMTPFHIKHGFTNPVHIEHVMCGATRVLENLRQILARLQQELPVVFYQSMVEEWLEINVISKVKQMEEIVKNCTKQIAIGGRIADYEGVEESMNECT